MSHDERRGVKMLLGKFRSQGGKTEDFVAMAVSDPIVVIRCPACERPLRAIPDVPINLLYLNLRVDAFDEVGAVQDCRQLPTGHPRANQPGKIRKIKRQVTSNAAKSAI